MKEKIDLRNDYDEKADVPHGTIYRKGSIVQAFWHTDSIGRPIPVERRAETWPLPNNRHGLREARRNFRQMVARSMDTPLEPENKTG